MLGFLGGRGLFLPNRHLPFQTVFFYISRVTLYVCIDWRGGASAQFLACVFVRFFFFFFEENLWSYIYFKKFIVNLSFVLVIFEGISHRYKKCSLWDLFLLYICEVMRLDGLKHFITVT